MDSLSHDPLCDPLFLSWVAGFVDGEGCFNVRRTNRPTRPLYNIVVVVSNCVRSPLDRMAKEFGYGHVYDVTTEGDRRPVFQYHVSGNDAQHYTGLIMPYLYVKRPHAILFLEFPCQAPGVRGGRALPDDMYFERERIHLAMKELNRVGPFEPKQLKLMEAQATYSV